MILRKFNYYPYSDLRIRTYKKVLGCEFGPTIAGKKSINRATRLREPLSKQHLSPYVCGRYDSQIRSTSSKILPTQNFARSVILIEKNQ